MPDFSQHVTIVECRGNDPRPWSSTNPSHMPPHYTSSKLQATSQHQHTRTASKCLYTDVTDVAGRAMGKKDGQNTERGGGNEFTLPGDWQFTRCHPHVHGRCAVDLQLRGWLPAADEYGSEA